MTMKLTVKTLKGGKFQVECEPSNTVVDVKGIIENLKSDLPAANMKLIHSGKVLKDDQTVEGCGIKPNEFLVVMISKPKKAAAPAPAAAAAVPAPTPATPAAAPAPATTPATPAATASTPAPAPAAVTETPAAASAPADPPAAPTQPDLSAEAISSLVGMGFPEAEVRHCLRAAQGNPDVAVEFLTNGIPPAVEAAISAGAASPASGSGSAGASGSAAASASGGSPLQALRDHPQFNDLRRLVQSNPQMLQTVLTQIGQQQPELLAEINANQGTFLEMMNEPVTEASSSSATTSSSAPSSRSSSAPASGGSEAGLPAGLGAGMMGMMEGMGNPAQMAQMIQSMSPAELEQMAQMMGLSADQLRTTAQMLGQIPPEQLQQYMMQAMGGAGGAGGAAAGGGAPPGAQILRLTADEMAAVDRLTEMGFDRAEAAQAFLACDKNEALAANLLMDSMGDGGGAFGFGGDNAGGGDDDDDMYD